MKRAGRFTAVLFVALCLYGPAFCQETALENDFLRVGISEKTGAIITLTNKATGKSYKITQTPFSITTDNGTFTGPGAPPTLIAKAKDLVAFSFKGNGLSVRLHYSLKSKRPFLQKWLTVRGTGHREFAIQEIVLERMAFDPALTNVLPYYSYAGRGGVAPGKVRCPTAMFVRTKGGGFFLGIENPFFQMEVKQDGIKLSYHPMLKVRDGEKYVSDRAFIGVYRKTKRFYVKELPKATGWVPDRFPDIWECLSHDELDWAEIWAMQDYMRSYMPPALSKMCVKLDGWWSQLPSLPAQPNRKDVDFVCAIADNLRQVGVDLMSLMAFPKEPAKLPDLATVGWEMNPNVEEVIRREKPKDTRFGVYLGDASAMKEYGNSGPRNFLPEKEEWKKRRPDGRAMAVNCLGCKEFAEWFFKVQDSTINHYDLAWWQWDGALGSWDACHAKNHNHVPGKSQYAEWRGRMEVIRQLKEAHPDLWIHVYWGLKPYGPWGLKWVDTHENYYEMGRSDMIPSIWADHKMADDGRLQFWWNQNCRFLPPYKNYAQVGHGAYGPGTKDPAAEMAQGEWWEENAWKYALLSAIGTSGSAVINVFPNDLKAVRSPDFMSFYRKWLGWANDNVEYLKVGRCIFGPPGPGVVDGYAHIIGDRGFVFLFNPNSRDINVALPLDEEIMLTAGQEFVITELYPLEGRNLIWRALGVFPRGMEVVITVPAEGVFVGEVKPYDKNLPKLFGLPGRVQRDGDALLIEDVCGEEGSIAQLLVLVDRPRAIKSVRVNSQEARFKVTKNQYIRSVVEFSGVRIIREMDNWDDEKGGRIKIPNERTFESVRLHTEFFLPGNVRDVLQARKPAPRPSGRPTPLTADASRLLVSLPFTFPGAIKKIMVKINDVEAPVHRAGLGRYVDITDHVLYDRGNSMEIDLSGLLPGQFLGPRIENVPVQITEQLRVISERARTLTKIGPSPKKPFWDAEAFRSVKARMQKTARTRAQLFRAYHAVHEQDGIPYRIELATRDRLDRKRGSENLFDGAKDDAGKAWEVETNGLVNVIVGFEGENVEVRGIRLWNNPLHPPNGLAKTFAVYTSTSDDARRDPRHPSWELALMDELKPECKGFQEFAFPPTKARYVRIQLIESYGGGAIGLGEVTFITK
ncbi:MAG: hypothetical protein GXP25_18735 [Planctomycetes bacterium]|nr:hypothetical protein [Planctomycetota bacterium]